MLTATSGEMARLAGFDARVNDYIANPFSMRQLILRVEQLLGLVPPAVRS